MGPHTHTPCYYHTPGEVLLIFRVFFFSCPSSSFGVCSWTIQPLPANGVSQGSVGYLLYINKGNYQLNWESSVASSAMPFSAVLYTNVLSWHALVKQCTGTAGIKGFIYFWAFSLKWKQNKYLSAVKLFLTGWNIAEILTSFVNQKCSRLAVALQRLAVCSTDNLHCIIYSFDW